MGWSRESSQAQEKSPSSNARGLRRGIRPSRERSFLLANGSEVTRRMGDAQLHFHDETASSPVIFGEPGDASLLGVISLETLGLILDPFQRKLLPMPMLLASQSLGQTRRLH
jgi:hypothetical protein